MNTVINTQQNPANAEAHQPAGGVVLAPGLIWVARLPRIDSETQRRLVDVSRHHQAAGEHLLAAAHYRLLAEQGGGHAKTYRVLAGRFEASAEGIRSLAYRSACGLIAYVESHWTAEEIAVARAARED